MKRYFVILLVVVLFSQGTYAQTTAADIFDRSKNNVIWLGIDYSHVKLYGTFSEITSPTGYHQLEKGPLEIRDRYFVEWNDLVIAESDKYNLEKALRKKSVPFDIRMTEITNSKTNIDKMFPKSSYGLNEDSISNIVANYDLSVIEAKEGIGMVAIMETMNKGKGQASMHITFFDLATQKVLLTERMTGAANGLGFRNYWIKPIYVVFIKIRDTQYAKWKAKTLN